MMSELGPDYLSDLESERQFASQGNRARRVKLEKGHAVMVRFLPFPMGPNKRPYARIANHWINFKPTVCPRNTHLDWGGNPEAYCPVCEAADYLHAHALNDEVRTAAYKVQANPQWLMWCLVMARDDSRSEVEYIESPELWKPWEFQISKTSWDELSVLMRRAAARGADILDVETGTNLWATRGKKGIRFDRDENGPSPIIRPDENYDEIIQKIWAGCKEPVVKIEDEHALAIVAEKLQDDFASGRYEGRRERSGGRGRDEDDDRGRSRGRDEDDDRGRGRSDDDDDLPPPPMRHRPVSATPPVRRSPAAAPAVLPVRRSAPGEGDDNVPMGDGQENPPSPPPRRTLPAAPARTAPATVPARPATTPPLASRRAAPPPLPPGRGAGTSLTRLPAAATAEAAPAGEGSIDENEEHVPEEQIDPAPPAEAPLPEGQDDPAAQGAPAPVPPPRRSLDATLRGRVNNLHRRGQ